MSIKTSDENVGNIEADVKILKHIKNDFDWDLQHPNSRSEGELQEAKKYSSAIEHILAEREQMLKKREKYTIRLTDEEYKKVIENAQMDTSNDRVIAHKFAVMQQQICEKDNRIQELEEESKKYIVQLTDEQYRNLVDKIRKKAKQEFEQKVKDKIAEYDKRMEEDAGHPNWVITDRIVMNVLQELLEGEK